MGRHKLRLQQVAADALVGNLRGEIGEIVASWVLLREFKAQAKQQRTKDMGADFRNPILIKLNSMERKLHNETISRLSELAERKIGQVNFHFVGIKLNILSAEITGFESFIVKHRFRECRNNFISHKKVPPPWEEGKMEIFVSYRTLLAGIAKALILMKQIDNLFLGPRATYLWHEMRKRRYISSPLTPSSSYMLLPYLHLEADARIRVINQEIALGKKVWEEIPTRINGQDASLRACKEWGIIEIGKRLIVLAEHPLVEIKNIELGYSMPTTS